MKNLVVKIIRLCSMVGLNINQLISFIRNMPSFLQDVKAYKKNVHQESFKVRFKNINPILNEKRATAGQAKGHYFFQDLWAAKKIFEKNPDKHIDIGSKIDSFIAHLLVFRTVTVVDIRPLENNVAGLTFIQSDATTLSNFQNNSVESLSSLHAVEHFGLGRYGDPIDPDACFKVMDAMVRVLKPGGRLYFSVPIGNERVEFNAHRIFDPETIVNRFKDLELISFSVVNDDGLLIENTDWIVYKKSRYACGLFEFSK